MWIERRQADRLQRMTRQFPAVLVTGARQTGKTSLLRHSFPKAAFVSLDLPSAALQADENRCSKCSRYSAGMRLRSTGLRVAARVHTPCRGCRRCE